ncbi:PTS fructose transporter subunit IIC, partial [candidate division KSB1 bacterium]
MRIIDVLKDENISLSLNGKSKNEIITELVELASNSENFIDKNKVLTSIFEREKTMSTGIGYGVAIPHGKSTGVK